jgi:ergothioneine biosynthesis protein EgtB
MSVSDLFAIVSAETGVSPLIQRYAAVRQTTDVIPEGLSAEDQMVQSMPEASPTKWHLAHTSWFFETFILKPTFPGYRLFHDDFTFLFNSYYKQLGSHPNRAFRGLFSRPSLGQVLDYRRHVDRHMLKLLADTVDDKVASLTEIGLNHEQQHQELIITDIKHGLWSNPLRPTWKANGRRSPSARANKMSTAAQWTDFDENLHSIGFAGDGFSFDNETPRHQVFLNRFSIASRLVSNSDYLEFMRDGGYSRSEFWLSDGWDAVKAQQWKAPLYWEEHDGRWTAFTTSGFQPLDLDEPACHISYYEADAYARWAGARLPSEAEWEIAASSQPIEGNFLESGRFHPCGASYLCSAGDTTCSAGDLVGSPGRRPAVQPLSKIFGDVWEWTSSPYTAYPGFRPAEGALGEYNGKFMINQMVLRGGSCATPQSHIRATYRNFFPPHARWQFMGIRLAK